MKPETQKPYNPNAAYETTESELLADKVRIYEGEFNKPHPNFKGLPPNYYPNTWNDVIIQILALAPIYVICGLLLWGFLVWGFKSPRSFAWVSFGCFMLYLAIIIVAVFIGSAERGRKEREYIEMKIMEQREAKERKKVEEMKQKELLNKYRNKEGREKGYGI